MLEVGGVSVVRQLDVMLHQAGLWVQEVGVAFVGHLPEVKMEQALVQQ